MDKTPRRPSEPSKLNAWKADVEVAKLSPEQRKVYNIIEKSDETVYITGKAGTGKSHLLEYFMNNTVKQAVVVAPTGIAALGVGGVTIHSFFRFPLDVIDPDEVSVDSRARKILRNIDTIVIDEASMIRVDLMEGINAKLKMARRSDEPFGGMQVVMFGDLYQLPPVVTDNQLHHHFDDTYGGMYFFNAPVFKEMELKIYELGKIFRQKDPEFRKVLNAIRNGDGSEAILTEINKQTQKAIPPSGFVTLAGTNSKVSAINHKQLAELGGVELTYEAEVTGDIKPSAYPTEKFLKLKPGAQIMMLKNDTKKPMRWANGTLGVVTKLGPEVVRINIDGVDHPVERTTWKKYRYDYDQVSGKLDKATTSEFTQFPMRLAWAVTIHKSQGKTYESVAVDMSHGAFAHGQTYVALSRCKSLEGLYLTTKIRREDIIVDPAIVEFMKQAKVLET